MTVVVCFRARSLLSSKTYAYFEVLSDLVDNSTRVQLQHDTIESEIRVFFRCFLRSCSVSAVHLDSLKAAFFLWAGLEMRNCFEQHFTCYSHAEI